MVRVMFVLPRSSLAPIGALKVIYSYADGLAERGHDVVLIHLRRDAEHVGASHVAGDPHPWYTTHPRVQSAWIASVDRRWLTRTSDVVVATHWQVVPVVGALPDRLGTKVLFLQDFESYWLGSADARLAIERSLRTPWPVIAASRPVQELVTAISGRTCPVVQCAIDQGLFTVRRPLDDPARDSVAFPARRERAKRTADAVRAMEIMREEVGQPIHVWCFGRYHPPGLPSWIVHHPQPSDAELRDLYNRTAVFVVPSELEGFGFAGAEAMACGAALVSTDNRGVAAYARHGESALLCRPRDPRALAAAAMSLVHDSERRRRIAAAGVCSVNQRSLRDAQAEFAAVLAQAASGEW